MASIEIVGSFFIEELTGDRRALKLSGRALPYRPFQLTGEQDVNVTWYPGSPVATGQVLGARELPTTLNGYWKDRFITPAVNEPAAPPPSLAQTAATVSGRPIASVKDLADLVDDMRRKGQEVQVRWLHTARRGFLKRFKQLWHDFRDLEWEMEFEWLSQAEEIPVTNVQREVDLPSVSDETSATLSQLEDVSPPAVGAALDPSFTDGLNSSILQMQQAVVDAGDAVFGAVDGALAPLDAARRMIGTLQFIRAESAEVIDRINSRVGRTVIAVERLADVAEIPTTTVIKVAGANFRMTRAARRNRHTATRNSIALARSIDSDLLDVIFARDGQDLRDISTVAYGTPDEHVRLRRFNGLRSSTLQAGQVVLIPQRGGGF